MIIDVKYAAILPEANYILVSNYPPLNEVWNYHYINKMHIITHKKLSNNEFNTGVWHIKRKHIQK